MSYTPAGGNKHIIHYCIAGRRGILPHPCLHLPTVGGASCPAYLRGAHKLGSFMSKESKE